VSESVQENNPLAQHLLQSLPKSLTEKVRAKPLFSDSSSSSSAATSSSGSDPEVEEILDLRRPLRNVRRTRLRVTLRSRKTDPKLIEQAHNSRRPLRNVRRLRPQVGWTILHQLKRQRHQIRPDVPMQMWQGQLDSLRLNHGGIRKSAWLQLTRRAFSPG
jgi:hypothetical protein